MMMVMDEDERSRDEISKLINIFSEVFSKDSMAQSSFFHFHRISQPTLSYFKVDRHPGGDLLLQLCDKDHVPWIKQLVKDSELRHVQDAIMAGVVKLIFWNLSDSFCLDVQKLSKAVDDFDFYHSAIAVAAALVYSLYPKHLLFKIGNCQLLERQMNDLWDQFTVWWNKGLSFYDVCKLLVVKLDKDKYSSITECDVILLLNYYYNQCCDGTVLYPSPLYLYSDEEEDNEEETDTTFNDIQEVVNKMGCFQIAKVDDYTRWLIKNFRGDAVTENETSANIDEPFFAEVLETVYTTDFQNSCWLSYLFKEGLSQEDIIFSFKQGLGNLSKNVIRLLEDHLSTVLDPLFRLCDSKFLELSPEVCEIIQVAEIRRIALGSRFISQKHFMWAFYECGYGLPVNFWREANINSDDEDHPPFHIYVASVKLAMLFGEKVMQLQHFVFAILHWELIGDGEEVIKMGEDFRVYIKVLDSIKKAKAASEDIIENDVEETGRDNVLYQFMEKNKKRRIETTKPELRPEGGYEF